MKLIPLSKFSKTNAGKYFAMVDDADYEWLNQWNWYALVTPKTTYAFRDRANQHKKRLPPIAMHRLILGITGRELIADHINHNGLDNQRANLRVATYKQNNGNKSPRANSTSKYLGVCLDKNSGKWAASIGINYTVKRIGVFADEEEAARAYDTEAIKHYGEFANLNFK